MVGDTINKMKTTFEWNFDLYKSFKQYGYTKIWKQREAVYSKSFSLITCKLVIRKKLVNNKNLNKKVVFKILILLLTTVGWRLNAVMFRGTPCIINYLPKKKQVKVLQGTLHVRNKSEQCSYSCLWSRILILVSNLEDLWDMFNPFSC